MWRNFHSTNVKKIIYKSIRFYTVVQLIQYYDYIKITKFNKILSIETTPTTCNTDSDNGLCHVLFQEERPVAYELIRAD